MKLFTVNSVRKACKFLNTDVDNFQLRLRATLCGVQKNVSNPYEWYWDQIDTTGPDKQIMWTLRL